MTATQLRGGQVLDGSVQRADLDATTAGAAVIRKVIAGTNVTLSSTGPDAGTGDVTINASGGGAPSDAKYLVGEVTASLPNSIYAHPSGSTTIATDYADVAGQVYWKRAALTGDVTAGYNSNATTISANAVTYAKMQQAGANTVIARANAAAGDLGEVALSASQLLGRGATGNVAAIALGTNLSMSGATLNASGGGGSFAVTSVTVDFGSVPVSSKAFSVTVTGASVGQKVIASASLDMPGTLSDDELEMDMLACAGRVTATNTVRVIVACVAGSQITGQRNINITLG